ncbi:rho GTPase-activating protein gacN-like isoform X1 [Onthophagus taurus]|uniref:rho GTPase-activating protein gacN-like isoform X1 n=1 Tax=Onthophagus taurus TaxID=166361 RepID=UPI0039BE28CA
MMFLNDVHKKDEIKNLAVQDLRGLGIKFRVKKPSRQNIQKTKSRKVFKVPLQTLPMKTVTLVSGQQLVVPKILDEMCSFLLTKVKTEGLFRKGGSKSRQNEIKLSLDAGCYLSDDHHEIDVASVLKTFFRELPDPLIPITFQDTLLHCIILSQSNLHAILLVCLLLPSEHLNILAYLMQFLYQITEFSNYNKMDAYNLAVVIGPTLLPVEEKVAPSATHRINKFCEVLKLLIENANQIGFVPEDIIERIALSCSSASLTDEDGAIVALKKKKKRRSGSLTRMLNGLKKIVTSKSGEGGGSQEGNGSREVVATPDLLVTPLLTRSAKKRKFDGAGFSMRKKKDLITKLPQSSTLATPFNPKTKEKDKKWLLKSKSKSIKTNEESVSISSRLSALGTKTMLERRWSQLSHVADFRKNKKRNSYGGSSQSNSDISKEIVQSTNLDHLNEIKEIANLREESDYVKIPRMEYEEIKSRVSEIERRISIELESNDKFPEEMITKNIDNIDTVKNVQCVYEHTLEQLQPMSPTADQLAKRLSRELKIRRSTEQKVIRSPSARKIGTLRRRSRDSDRQKLIRNKTWHISSTHNSPISNTNQLNHPIIQKEIQLPITPVLSNPLTPKSLDSNRYSLRSLSFNGSSSPSITKPKKRLSDNWKSSKEFFENSQQSSLSSSSNFDASERCRASLIRLRNQNAGMVLAKARLFDDLVDTDLSNPNINNSNPIPNSVKCTPNLIPRVQTNKLGAIRQVDRQSNRIRALKAEENTRRLKKNTISPRKRMTKSPKRLQRLRNDQVAVVIDEGKVVNKENDLKDGCVLGVYGKTRGSPLRDMNFRDVKDSSLTPRAAVPHIKRPFNVKSPKRLNRGMLLQPEKNTPLKVIATIREKY